MIPRVRFAPSPTGSLHLGNARTALYNWLFTRGRGGAFILRIEDTDLEREVPGAEEWIRRDLAWLGLDWDEGPDIGGAFGPYRQSERAHLYREAAQDLLRRAAAYPCFCAPDRLEEDRREQSARGETPRYLRHCEAIGESEAARRREAGEPAALRLRVDSYPAVTDLLRGAVDFSSRVATDAILVRRDGRPTYNFAVVVDDVAMKITHVLRGDDHLSNTPVQVRIYEAFGAPPPHFAHLPTVLGPDGSPLSKRHGAVSLAEMRRQGQPAEALATALMLLGWTPPGPAEAESAAGPLPLGRAAEVFDLASVSVSPSTFDRARLGFLGARALAALPDAVRGERFLRWLPEAREAAEALPEDSWIRRLPGVERWSPAASEWLGALLGLWAGSTGRFADFDGPARFVFAFDEALGASEASGELGELRSPEAIAAVTAFLAAARSAGGRIRTEPAWLEIVAEARKATGLAGRAFFHPLRIALTGSSSGPEMKRMVPLIDGAGERGAPVEVASSTDRIERTLARIGSPA
jgi:glutamyl-tRNA synthetase